jgi:hypothetical protein
MAAIYGIGKHGDYMNVCPNPVGGKLFPNTDAELSLFLVLFVKSELKTIRPRYSYP